LTDEQHIANKIAKRLRRRHNKEVARAAAFQTAESARIGRLETQVTDSSESDREEHEKEAEVKLDELTQIIVDVDSLREANRRRYGMIEQCRARRVGQRISVSKEFTCARGCGAIHDLPTIAAHELSCTHEGQPEDLAWFVPQTEEGIADEAKIIAEFEAEAKQSQDRLVAGLPASSSGAASSSGDVEGLPAPSSAASSSGDIAPKPMQSTKVSQATSDKAWAKLHASRAKRKAATDAVAEEALEVAEEVPDLTEDDVYVGDAGSSSLDRMD
jgi:hypothetical protein